ncbi:hypothetical protein [Burkholderia cenocepacia]|uniref:hypothetical protein n=1 Tax=Burkholderia cenocepacia TaxID=95486 RepID=UPI002AB2E3D2|nr:hypothetical protein [Burkholderia cenocepacia]
MYLLYERRFDFSRIFPFVLKARENKRRLKIFKSRLLMAEGIVSIRCIKKAAAPRTIVRVAARPDEAGRSHDVKLG